MSKRTRRGLWVVAFLSLSAAAFAADPTCWNWADPGLCAEAESKECGACTPCGSKIDPVTWTTWSVK